jgi:hypothetical protein
MELLFDGKLIDEKLHQCKTECGMSSINPCQRSASYAIAPTTAAMPCHMRMIKLKGMLSRDNNAELNNDTHYIQGDIYTDLITSHLI